MENAAPSVTPAPRDIDVLVVSPEEASYGVAEFWCGGRQIGFTRIEDGELAVRIDAGPGDAALAPHTLAKAVAEANRLLALY